MNKDDHLLMAAHLGLWEDTAVIFMSDHGHYIGDHGRIGKSGQGPDGDWPYYEEVSHTAFMGYVPGGKAAGKRTKFLTQPIDFMPTILDLAGIKKPSGLHGVSVAPILKGGKAKELYDFRKDLAQKKNVYSRRNMPVARRLQKAYLEVLKQAGTPEEKFALRTKLPKV